jgi:GNAT superfamily N-acetyltransferase
MTNIDQAPVNARALAAEIEPHAIASWPPREAVWQNDWLLRFTNGFTHRGNSVATLQFGGSNLDTAIDAVEHEYRKRALAPMFQVASLVAPTDLAGVLIARGYEAITPTFVRATTPAALLANLPEQGDLAISHVPDADFISLVVEGSRSEGDGAERLEILSRISAERICLTAFAEGRAVACGTGTLVGGHVGINMMRTALTHRRQGHAQRVLSALARWAKQTGAIRVYLGVERANAPALALYTRAGFIPAYVYCYYRKAQLQNGLQPFGNGDTPITRA